MRILFTATQLPDPPHSGGAQRTRLLLEELLQIGSVDVGLVLPSEPEGAALDWLHSRCERVQVVTKAALQRDRPAHLVRRLLPRRPGEDLAFLVDAEAYRWEQNATATASIGKLLDYDLVVARYLQSAANFGLFAHPRLILDVDDYLPDRLRSRLADVNPIRRMALRRTMKRATEAFVRLVPQAAQCWVSNAEDRRHPGLASAMHLPNIPWPYETRDGSGVCGISAGSSGVLTAPFILMVGTFSYSANREGLNWFLKRVWPLLRGQLPQLRLAVVGGGTSERDGRRWSAAPGVSVIGRVESLAPWYRGAAAVITPLRSGAGTNIKVLEAAAAARCVVATPMSLRGLRADLVPGDHCFEADQPGDFAAACRLALEQPQLAAAIGAAAQRVVAARYSRKRFTTVVTDTVRKVCAC